MKRKPRIYYSDSHNALMWERWKKGESLQQIAQLFDRNHSSVSRILAETGGIRPPQRHRSQLALTLAEREEISRALVAGQSMRSIAAQLGRAPSTVSREIERNGGQDCYRATQADQAAWERALRPKSCKLVEKRKFANIVAGKLQLQLNRRSKLRGGSSRPMWTTRIIRCQLRPFIAVSSSKPVAP